MQAKLSANEKFNTHSHRLNKLAYESIITNNRSLHLNDVSVRMHNYHSLIPPLERWIVVDSLKTLILTILVTAEQNIWFFQYREKNFSEQKNLLSHK